MGHIGCPETSVTNCQSALRDTPEKRMCDLTKNLFTLVQSVKLSSHFNTKNWRHDEFFKQTLNSHVTIHSKLPLIQAGEISLTFTVRHFNVAYCVQICEHAKWHFRHRHLVHWKAAKLPCTFDVSTCSRWYYQCQWFQSAATVELSTQPNCIHTAVWSLPSSIKNTCQSARFMNWWTCIPHMALHVAKRSHSRIRNISHPGFKTINICNLWSMTLYLVTVLNQFNVGKSVHHHTIQIN
jgi:hypothetical protein